MAGVRRYVASLLVRLVLTLRRHEHQWSPWIAVHNRTFNVYRSDFMSIRGIRRGCLTCGREETRWGEMWQQLLKDDQLAIATRNRGHRG